MCGRGCDQDWDVRCCCELDCPSKNTNEQFYKCPMKLNTIHFHIGNDFIYYQYANSNKWDKIKELINTMFTSEGVYFLYLLLIIVSVVAFFIVLDYQNPLNLNY